MSSIQFENMQIHTTSFTIGEFIDTSILDYGVAGYWPETILDFVNDYYVSMNNVNTFSEIIAINRTTSATYYDSQGFLQTATENVARIPSYIYDGSAWVNAGLMVDGFSSNNYILYSNTFDSIEWANSSNCYVTSGANTGPGGATCMWNLVDNNTGGTGRCFIEANTTLLEDGLDTDYTFSVYARANGCAWIGLSFGADPGSNFTYYDLANGVVGGGTYSTNRRTMENIGNGIWRLMWSADTTANNIFCRIHACEINNSIDVTLDGNSSIEIFGAQMENSVARAAGSYIETTGTAVYRNADGFSIRPGRANNAHASGTMALYGLQTLADENIGFDRTMMQWYADAGNFMQMRHRTDVSPNGIRYRILTSVGGGADMDQYRGPSGIPNSIPYMAVNNEIQVALRWNWGSTASGYLNGDRSPSSTIGTRQTAYSSVPIDIWTGITGYLKLIRIWDSEMTIDAGNTATSWSY